MVGCISIPTGPATNNKEHLELIPHLPVASSNITPKNLFLTSNLSNNPKHTQRLATFNCSIWLSSLFSHPYMVLINGTDLVDPSYECFCICIIFHNFSHVLFKQSRSITQFPLLLKEAVLLNHWCNSRISVFLNSKSSQWWLADHANLQNSQFQLYVKLSFSLSNLQNAFIFTLRGFFGHILQITQVNISHPCVKGK